LLQLIRLLLFLTACLLFYLYYHSTTNFPLSDSPPQSATAHGDCSTTL
jgi:hypothetical protein